jgi:serine/threonine protein phosphatase 1
MRIAGQKIVDRYEKNSDGRDFVCGDIHGCYDELEYHLKKIRFDPTRDRMFCVGDLFDRGPRSRDALKYLGENWFFPVRGNHEDMFIEWFLSYDLDKHSNYENGSSWQFKENKSYLAELGKALLKLPLIIVVGDNLIVHACLPEVDSLEAIEREPEKYLHTLLWYRGNFSGKIIPGIKRVYCGHSIISAPEERNGFMNIDTGAFLRYMGEEGKLTVRRLL